MSTTMTKLSVFLNTWGNYNENGADNGFWVDLPCNLSETLERLATSTGEDRDEMEVFINNFDTEINGLEISECDSISKLNELAEALEKLDEYDLEKIEAILEVEGGDFMEILESLDNYEYYSGVTLEELAWEFVEDMGLPEVALNYFDIEKFARDLSYDNYTETTNGVLYRG